MPSEKEGLYTLCFPVIICSLSKLMILVIKALCTRLDLFG